jgi:hypothetical protein
MAKPRVQRIPLKINKSAEITPFERVVNWDIKTQLKNPINAVSFRDIHDGEKILIELRIFIRGQRKPSGSVGKILNYIDYVAIIGGMVGAKSLSMYIEELNSKADHANTVMQNVSTIKCFLKHLIDATIIPQEQLPETPEGGPAKGKSSFFEIASRDLEGLADALKSYKTLISEYELKYRLDTTSAGVCFFCDESMRLIHEHSLKDLHESLDDIDFCDSIISSITDDDFIRYKGIDNFSEAFKDSRTVVEAFSILYSRYGQQDKVPSPDYWPKGLYDFLKIRGYRVADIRNELFLLNSAPSEMMLEAVRDLSKENIDRYKKVENYSYKHFSMKSVEVCFKILFINYGRFLPIAEDWPVGLVDYCKVKQWNTKRIYSAFFPDRQVHQPLFLAYLSHEELAPNVDTVFKYTYLDAITPAFEPKKVRVFMGKFRGAPVDKDLSNNDQLVILTIRYIKKYKSILTMSDLGIAYLSQENPSIFGHINRNRGEFELKTYDVCTACDWVHISLEKYAKEHPIIKPLTFKGTTGENFRPTHAVIDTLKGVPQGKIKLKLNHKRTSTTTQYTENAVTDAQIDTKQMNFQTFIVNQSKLSVDELKDTVDSSLNLQELAYSKRVIFSDVHDIAEWIAYRAEIVKEKDRLILSNPKRWVKYWQVKLAEYEALISMVTSQDYHAATILSDELTIPYLD